MREKLEEFFQKMESARSVIKEKEKKDTGLPAFLVS
jgi:hypothetical protein